MVEKTLTMIRFVVEASPVRTLAGMVGGIA